MKEFTAEEFRIQPAKVYRAADRGAITGDKVIIRHNSYRDIDFVLTAINRDGENK